MLTKVNPMSVPEGHLRARAATVAVVPCDRQKGCFRWVILGSDGTCLERSAFAHASVAGARAVGEIRRRELRLG